MQLGNGLGLRLFRIEPESLELPAPFGRRIAEPLDADATGQATFYGGFDQVGSEEGKRDRHVDLPNTALLADADFLDCRYSPPMFMRGDYDVSVFQAFKDVEIAVRKAAGLSDSDIGRKLMQAAFRPDGGPLTIAGDKGEQVGLMDLFSGAIGCCKNPASHRSPGFNHIEAAQLITFASFLLNQLEEMVTSSSYPPTFDASTTTLVLIPTRRRDRHIVVDHLNTS